MRATARKIKGSNPSDPMPVHVEKRGYGLLYPTARARKGCGVVQFGSDGPFEEHKLDRMMRVTQEEFEANS